jgi:hypothetical protein
MSAIRTMTLSAATLIALIGPGSAFTGPGAAQVLTQPTGVLSNPAVIGAIAAPAAVRPDTANVASATGEGSASLAAMSENAYDFTNPDSIPGFGSLPHDYDAAAVMPRFGSQ